jgi:hypothetical protein
MNPAAILGISVLQEVARAARRLSYLWISGQGAMLFLENIPAQPR